MPKDHEIPRYHSRRGAERAVDDADRIWEIIAPGIRAKRSYCNGSDGLGGRMGPN